MWCCARFAYDTNRPEGKAKLKPAGETSGILGGAQFRLRAVVQHTVCHCLSHRRWCERNGPKTMNEASSDASHIRV